ncbi:MAG: excinuclease ABC subunit UvrA [Patescibacteria group bacterium]|nr:excinuclease ABC subunit UvrA [Patescibacteria group bacterium]MDD3778010.1 excinuclease ABC subunit UvrA [Patescibacteria group bacterium]MDD3939155.1 excinuclease ABC subunit UvrA [Patescibacteria group bacterium]NCU39646.1 excinuclease ABC subunit A [Candidatus Falkowbacteria bacterium]
MSNDFIKIRGARTNNLKNINLDIPRNKLVVITGLSGSGKSSLAFDTIYAEGQRRYVESLSSYARQFVGLMNKPEVDLIEGLSPAISIDQRTVSHNPRSTVGTITDVYDYLRLLFAKCGDPYCPNCGVKMEVAAEIKKIEKVVKGKITKSNKVERYFVCPQCSYKKTLNEPREFSFNSGHGACPDCGGLGDKLEINENLIFNEKLSILEGAIKPLSHSNLNGGSLVKELEGLATRLSFDLNTPIKNLSVQIKKTLLQGDDEFIGLIKYLSNKYKETKSNFVKLEIEKVMHNVLCPSCLGARLKPESLLVKIGDYNIYDVTSLSIEKALNLFTTWQNDPQFFEKIKEIAQPILKEIIYNLELMINVGLGYLSLARPAITLSGGEAQRIRLSSQVGSSLSGVLYVLDEPSVGLHQRDNDKLIKTLQKLRDNGNTVIVVEHDEATMIAADYLIDIGPGAGENGGNIIFTGLPQEILSSSESLTGQYLKGQKKIFSTIKKRPGSGKKIEIIGAGEHNLKNINVSFPLGKLVAVTGVSGSGKSSLMNDILANYLSQKFYRSKVEPGKFDKILGVENINKVINIDQSPIGKTPRSNPATYTGIFTLIRDIFAQLPEARVKGLTPGHFSFNVPGGRCENCSGDGAIKIEMQFLNDVFVTCDVCGGRKFKEKILEIKYRGKNIYEVLEMTISEAKKFFKDVKPIITKLATLEEVGLGYIKLGQSAITFSGGEAQRIKLATELSRRSTGKTLYILDEPTTGLHFYDIDRLLKVLGMLADQGNTVIVIEHNLDVIKAMDWVIDLGPEGGEHGGYLIAEGTPEMIARNKKSITGQYLKKII